MLRITEFHLHDDAILASRRWSEPFDAMGPARLGVQKQPALTWEELRPGLLAVLGDFFGEVVVPFRRQKSHV